MKREKGKKGFTLVELSVVIALVAIISAMVLSHVIMISNRTSTNAKKISLMQDVVKTEALVSSWLNDVYLLDGETTVLNGNVKATISGEEYTLTLSDGKLKCKLPEGEKEATLEIASSITFHIEEKSGEKLYFCTLSYALKKGDNASLDKYVFTVNPKIGETITLSTEEGN